MFINLGHGVINVRKREENRQTNSSGVMAVLMITKTVWLKSEREREGRGESNAQGEWKANWSELEGDI